MRLRVAVLILVLIGFALVARFGPFDRQRLAVLSGASVISSRSIVLDLFGRPDYVRDSMVGDTYAYRMSAQHLVVYTFAIEPTNASNREDRVLTLNYWDGPGIEIALDRENLRPPEIPGSTRPPG